MPEHSLQHCCLRSMAVAAGGDREKLREMLMAYYTSEKGRREVAASPNARRPVAEIVDDILREVF